MPAASRKAMGLKAGDSVLLSLDDDGLHLQGTGLRSLTREGREIVDVPDGIVFPILSSLSVFAKKTDGTCRIDRPRHLTDTELTNAAKTVYMQIAGSNPQTMGKKAACYNSMLRLTTVYKKLIPDG